MPDLVTVLRSNATGLPLPVLAAALACTLSGSGLALPRSDVPDAAPGDMCSDVGDWLRARSGATPFDDAAGDGARGVGASMALSAEMRRPLDLARPEDATIVAARDGAWSIYAHNCVLLGRLPPVSEL